MKEEEEEEKKEAPAGEGQRCVEGMKEVRKVDIQYGQKKILYPIC